ncbi:MAG TPA: antitoxin VapB family protein [Candidatus Thermoplasmatota archaeon]|nr:antitoxin VapB family protein [Candidatus Thermoplasmatota archaeon]
MATKTLTITEAAYEALAKHKRPGESFTDVVLRLAGRRSLGDLAEAFTPGEARALAEAMIAARDARRDPRRRRE